MRVRTEFLAPKGGGCTEATPRPRRYLDGNLHSPTWRPSTGEFNDPALRGVAAHDSHELPTAYCAPLLNSGPRTEQHPTCHSLEYPGFSALHHQTMVSRCNTRPVLRVSSQPALARAHHGARTKELIFTSRSGSDVLNLNLVPAKKMTAKALMPSFSSCFSSRRGSSSNQFFKATLF